MNVKWALIVEYLLKFSIDQYSHLYCSQENSNKKIEYKKQEIFAIVKSDTIINPGAMMIHIQNALLTFRTVVTSFRFKIMANQAVFSLFMNILVDSPVQRYGSWLSNHHCDIRPNSHEKEKRSENQPRYDHVLPVSINKLVDIYEEYNSLSDYDCDKVRIFEVELAARSKIRHVVIINLWPKYWYEIN